MLYTTNFNYQQHDAIINLCLSSINIDYTGILQEITVVMSYILLDDLFNIVC